MSTISTSVTSVVMGQNGVTSPLTVTAMGSVTGGGSAPAISNAYGSITNFGSITNTGPNTDPSTVGIRQGGTTLTVVNTGLISGSRSGVYNNVGGTLAVTNGSTGSISGLIGVLTFDTAQIRNQGMISGGNTGVLQLGTATGTVTNTGVITGLQGMFMDGPNGTVINAGTISGTYGLGVQLNAGGVVTNAAGGRITGGGTYAAVGITGGTARLMNAGTIAGDIGVLLSDAADTLTLAAGGTIIGTAGTAVSFGGGDDAMLLSPGAMSIAGTVDGGAGTDSFSVGAAATTLTGTNASFVNFETASIAAGGTLAVLGTASFGAGLTLASAGALDVRGTVSNAGAITGSGTGMVSVTGGTLRNAAGGMVARADGRAVVQVLASGTVANLGTIISSSSGSGVNLNGGGTVVNGSAGKFATIVSQSGEAVYSNGGPTTVTNFGTLQGINGVDLIGTGTVINGASGATAARIDAVGYGILVTGAATVTNFGTVALANNNPFTFAVELRGGGTMTNAGLVSAGAGTGVRFRAAGSITNTGTITGATGVTVTGANVTLTNAGSITGTGGTAVSLAAASDTLKLMPGGVMTGIATGDTGTLELAAGTATLSGLGTQYVNFGTLLVDAGAVWTLDGSTTYAGAVTDNGTLVVQAGQTLILSGALGASAGQSGRITVTGSATLTLSGAVASSQVLDLSDTGGLLLLNAPMSMAGTVAGFGVGDRVDFGSVGTATSATLGANNVLTLSGTMGGPVSLQLDPTVNYGGSFFAVAADGMGGTVVTLDTVPVLGGTAAGQTVTDKVTNQPFAAVTLGDPDAGAAETVTITLTAGGVASDADGVLSGPGLTRTDTGTYALAAGTPNAVQAALRGLVFTPTNNQVAPGGTVTTAFQLSVSDGIATPATTDNTTSVVATSVNDAPTIAGTSATARQVDDNATVSPFTAVTVGDVDNPTQTQTVTVTLSAPADGTLSTGSGFAVTATAGVYNFSGTAAQATTALRGLVFTPTNNQISAGATESEGFTIAIDDGAGGTASDGSTNVTITSVDDAPTIAGTVAHQVTNDQMPVAPFSMVLIGDVDAGATETVTIVLKAGGVATDADGTLSGAGIIKTGTGTYAVTTGSPQAVQSLLRAATFTPTSLQVPPSQVVSTEFDLRVVDDVGLAATDTTTSVDAKAVPAAPALALSDDTGPSGTDRLTSDPAITYTKNMAADSLLYSADGGAYATSAPNFATDGSADGQHTVSVEERDPSGNVGPAASLTFVLDTRPPAVSSPSRTVAQNSGPTPIGIAAPSDNLTPSGNLAIAAGALPTNGIVTLADGRTPVTTGQALTVAQLTGLEFTPTPGVAGQGSTFTYTVTDGAGNATTGAAALNVGAAGAPTITGTHATTDRAEAAVAPFAGVTVTDPSSAAGATETLVITLTGQGGTLTGAGLTRAADGSYQLAGTALAVTQQLDALSLTPTAGAPGTTTSTTFVLTDRSSSGTSVADSGTSVADTAAAAPPPPPPPGQPAPDTVSFNDQVYYDQGFLVVSGRSSSAAGVSKVEITAEVDGVATDLGAATVDANGNFSFRDLVGRHTQGFITATETDGAGATASAQADFSLTGGGIGGGYRARQDRYNADGSVITATDSYKASGAQNATLNTGGLTFLSDTKDVFENGGQPGSTFVFGTGYGRDVVDLFRPDNTDHDTLSFLGSSFNNDIANVLAHTFNDRNGDAVIHDPGTKGDSVVLIGVSRQQFATYAQQDVTFHA